MNYVENLCLKSLRVILKPGTEILPTRRPDWLRNPSTGRNLELDFYMPTMKLGIEIQGPTHYEDLAQQERDRLKRELCKENGIDLIELTIFQGNPSHLHDRLAPSMVGF